MAMTLEEAQLQLTQINAAIENLLQGKRITLLNVGSGTFRRTYQYQEVSYEALVAKQQELMAYINSLSETLPTFRSGSVPLYVRKNR